MIDDSDSDCDVVLMHTSKPNPDPVRKSSADASPATHEDASTAAPPSDEAETEFVALQTDLKVLLDRARELNIRITVKSTYFMLGL